MTEQQARKEVAQDWRDMAHAIHKEDAYASHVTDETKEQLLRDHLSFADDIESGVANGFTIWQRIRYKMTGECVALLP